LQFSKNSINLILIHLFIVRLSVTKYACEPSQMIVKIILLIDVLGKTSNDKCHIKSWYKCSRCNIFSIDILAESNSFLYGYMKAHVDTRLFF
jgi:hypothetical protein